MVSEILKTLAVNAFFGWQMYERQDLLESAETFQSIEHYRNLLNKVESTADFMFDTSQELLVHASNVVPAEEDYCVEGEVVSVRERNRLITLAHSKKRNRVAFFKSPEGTMLRVSVRGHTSRKIQFHTVHCAARTGLGGEGTELHFLVLSATYTFASEITQVYGRVVGVCSILRQIFHCGLLLLLHLVRLVRVLEAEMNLLISKFNTKLLTYRKNLRAVLVRVKTARMQLLQAIQYHV